MPGKRLYSTIVEASWLDALDHVNFLEYQRAADKASDRFWLEIGGEMPSPRTRLSFVIVETYASYQRELRLGDAVVIDTVLVGYDQRRVHLHHSVLRGEELASSVQILGLAFDLDSRRASHWTPHMLAELAVWQPRLDATLLDHLMDWGLSGHAVV
jgi:acyl-CoA thioesterase FadM